MTKVNDTTKAGSVFLVFNANGHVIAVCSNYDKAEEIFRSEHVDFDPSVGIEEFKIDVKQLLPHICKYCGVKTTQPDEECYKAPK